MDMEIGGSALLFGSIFIAVLALALYVFIPSIREAEKKEAAFRNRPLEEKYAKEIASGEVVVIRLDNKKAFEILVWVLIVTGLVMILHGKSQSYINHLSATCDQLWGLSGFLVQIAFLAIAGVLLTSVLMFICVSEYRAGLKDGYFPPRTGMNFTKIKISRKITKNIKLKMQLQLMMCGVVSLLVLSLPVGITLILTKVTKQNFNSLPELNEYFQKGCVDSLKDKMKSQ